MEVKMFIFATSLGNPWTTNREKGDTTIGV